MTRAEICGNRMRRRWYTHILGLRFGVEHSTVHFVEPGSEGKRYLERFILYFGFGTLRVHRFWEGDDARAVHDHPWWFITIPLRGYWETVSAPEPPYRGAPLADFRFIRYVSPFRPHFRAAEHRHIVHMRHPHYERATHARYKPIWTLVLTGRNTRTWGFYPEPDQFVPFKDWEEFCQRNQL